MSAQEESHDQTTQGEPVGGVQRIDGREAESGQEEIRALREGGQEEGKLSGIPPWMPQFLSDVCVMVQGGVGATARTLAAHWAAEFPGWKYLAVEPHPRAVRLAEAAWPGVVLPYAIHDRVDNVALHSCGSESGALNRPLGVAGHKSWWVGTTTLDDVAEYADWPEGVFLWLDVPDDPLPGLRSADRLLQRTVALAVRVPMAPRYVHQARREEVEAFLCDAGFRLLRVFACTPRWALTFWQPR